MSKAQRVTLTLPSDVLDQAREASQGNLSQFIGDVLREHLEYKRLERLRDALIAGATANAEDDRAIAEEFRYADYEATIKLVPPSPELEQEHAGEFSSTR